MSLKKYLKYSWYLLPGYGLYREIKKPTENRKIHTFVGWTIYSSGAILKLAMIPAYINLGIQTGNWNPFRPEELYKNTKQGIEKIFEKKKGNSEKTFYIKSSTENSENNKKTKSN